MEEFNVSPKELSSIQSMVHGSMQEEVRVLCEALAEAKTERQVQVVGLQLVQSMLTKLIQFRAVTGHLNFAGAEKDMRRHSGDYMVSSGNYKSHNRELQLSSTESQLINALSIIDSSMRVFCGDLESADFKVAGRMQNDSEDYAVGGIAHGETTATYAMKQMATLLPSILNQIRPPKVADKPNVHERLRYIEYLKTCPESEETKAKITTIEAEIEQSLLPSPVA